MAEVKVTVEVLGKKLTKDEATALYYELQKELGMPTNISNTPISSTTNPYWLTQPVIRGSISGIREARDYG